MEKTLNHCLKKVGIVCKGMHFRLVTPQDTRKEYMHFPVTPVQHLVLAPFLGSKRRRIKNY